MSTFPIAAVLSVCLYLANTAAAQAPTSPRGAH